MTKNIICFKCKVKLEDKFSYCPECGAKVMKSPFKNDVEQTSKSKGIGLLGYLIIAALLILVYAVLNMQSFVSHRNSISSEQNSRTLASEENVIVEEDTTTSDIEIVEDLILDAAPAEGENYSENRLSIPMKDSNENNRYFLTSHQKDNQLHTITYVRIGNDADAFGKMEINCTKNLIRKISVENQNSLLSSNLDLGPWYTPTPDWTDKDIFNFICNR